MAREMKVMARASGMEWWMASPNEAAESVRGVYGQGGVDPAFDVDAQGASGPARAGVRVGDALDAGGGVFGGDQHTVVDAVAQAVGDLGGDFVADMADEQGDGEPGDGVAPRLAQRDRDEPDELYVRSYGAD
jgi:hypothetical protein